MAEAEIGAARRVLFVQATEPAGYPPLINASLLMAEAGWQVAFLSSPIDGKSLRLPLHPRITVHALPARPSHIMTKTAYATYCAAAARLAYRLRPDVIYASDPLGAGPGLLAARIARARLVYHEHDSPNPGTLRPGIARMRKAAVRRARLIVFPNAARARIAQDELGFPDERLHIAWNTPLRTELQAPLRQPEPPLVLYYHGSITPARLPETVLEAIHQFGGRIRLTIAGYEAPGASGYLVRLLTAAKTLAQVDYVGEIPLRSDLLAAAARAHVGLALMPRRADDINLLHMTGASNKPFDYMAAGLALLVSDLPDWRELFVAPGYARPCDPHDAGSIAAALCGLINDPAGRNAMAARARAKIATDWNYATAFAPVLAALADA